MAPRDEMYVANNPSPVDEQVQHLVGKDLAEMTETFMAVAMEDVANGFGPVELREMWELLCKEPTLFGASAGFSFSGKSGDDANTVTEVDDSDEGSSDESSDSDSSSAESGMVVASRMWSDERGAHPKGLFFVVA